MDEQENVHIMLLTAPLFIQRVWRDVLREYEFYYEDRPHTPDYLKFNVLGEI